MKLQKVKRNNSRFHVPSALNLFRSMGSRLRQGSRISIQTIRAKQLSTVQLMKARYSGRKDRSRSQSNISSSFSLKSLATNALRR